LSNPGEDLWFFESIAALVLFAVVLAGWIFPRERAALAFSEAEVAFLFPAPISRRGLIHYKLIRSQVAIVFTTFFLLLVSHRFGGKAWIHAAGWWCILSTLNLHLLAASFARTKLADRGITTWQRRTAILLVVGAAVGLTLWWARRTLPEFQIVQIQGVDDLKIFFKAALNSGPLPWLLLPFRVVVRPYFAFDGVVFLRALAPVAVILLAHYWWVVRANVAFEEASVEVSRRLAEKIALMRSGNWQARSRLKAGKRPPFRLHPVGPAPVALLWKNLISLGQAFSARFWILISIVGVSFTVAIGRTMAGEGVIMALGMISGTFIIWSLLLGPQVLRQDFRQDLALVDVLKSFPLRGWQVALGELLAPAIILSCFQWLLLIISVGLLLQTPFSVVRRPELVAIGFSAAILLPMLNLLTLQIPNAAALLFPAWFQPGKDAPQGIEATGQRIIFMLGQILAFLLALVPAGIAFALVFVLGKMFAVTAWCIPAASLVAAAVLAAEAGCGIFLLGRVFERFDAAEVPPA
jgi:ABC-2 type transport system permease protein